MSVKHMARIVSLHCNEGTSNKEYCIKLVPSVNSTTLWNIVFSYGKVGARLKHGQKLFNADYKTAITLFANVVREKLKGGYRDITDEMDRNIFYNAIYRDWLAGMFHEKKVTDDEYLRLRDLLLSPDSESRTLAINIIDTRNQKQAA